MSFVSVRTRENFSPARKVLSTTAPPFNAFNFVRTNAPPLPGLTCWNSTIRQVWPSSSMCMPLRNSFVETGAIARRRLANEGELFGEGGEQLDAVLADDSEVLDPHAAHAGQVDARL